MGKLRNLDVDRLKKPGRYGDGDGLYLQVTKSGTKSWAFRYRINHGGQKQDRQMGLGPYPAISLQQARLRALDAKRLLLDGIDPIRARDERRASSVGKPTFAKCAAYCIDDLKAGWKNDKHAAQWSSTLEAYALPVIGQLPVDEIEIDHILSVLQPIWTTKTETASRLRGRIETVLDWAKVKKFREGDNPARWRGNLNKLLPKPSAVAEVRHHPALPFTEMAEFMAELRGRDGMAARALEFAILTAATSGEVRGADWAEFDLTLRLWIVPASRMKAGKEHAVPLSAAAMDVITPLHEITQAGLVFPSPRAARKLSDMSLSAVLKRMCRQDITVHGFRSAFRDWAGEQTNYPRDVAEAALAHTVGDKTELAYRRGTAIEKRRTLMEAWADYCAAADSGGKVIPIARAK